MIFKIRKFPGKQNSVVSYHQIIPNCSNETGYCHSNRPKTDSFNVHSLVLNVTHSCVVLIHFSHVPILWLWAIIGHCMKQIYQLFASFWTKLYTCLGLSIRPVQFFWEKCLKLHEGPWAKRWVHTNFYLIRASLDHVFRAAKMWVFRPITTESTIFCSPRDVVNWCPNFNEEWLHSHFGPRAPWSLRNFPKKFGMA